LQSLRPLLAEILLEPGGLTGPVHVRIHAMSPIVLFGVGRSIPSKMLQCNMKLQGSACSS
jgi:hypothetical protein